MPEATSDTPNNEHLKGPIAWMARNGVAANLLMVILIVGGIGMSLQIKKEVMPDSTLNVIEVDVSYPGASPAEVEQGVLLPVEEAIRGVEGIKEVTSTARESFGDLTVELTKNTGRDRGLQRINQVIDGIQTFPDEAEEPDVSLESERREVLEVALHGETSRWSLRQIAERVRDRLVRHDRITQAELEFSADYITHVEVPQERLRAYGLTLQEIANQIEGASLDVPGGRVETEKGKIMLRVKERKQWAQEFGSIPIVTTDKGSIVRLSDLGSVRDGFEETEFYSEFSGKPSIEIAVYRVGDQTPIEVSEAVQETMKSMESQFPPGLSYRITDNRADDYRQRLSLLLRNGFIGLVLVLTVLGIFLEYRLATWVTVGMFTAFTGSLLFLPLFDVSINMISMFAFLVALGIVVDDAIVVGENIYEYRERGMGGMESAIKGAQDMAVPVTFAILTNCVAFVPLLFIPGEMGLIWSTIPVVLIVVFLISLFEALFVLPAHLGHSSSSDGNRLSRFLHRHQQSFSRRFRSKVNTILRPLLSACVHNRYISIGIAVALLSSLAGYALSDRMGMILMPQIPSREFAASANMPVDVTDKKARSVAERLTQAAMDVIENNGGKKLAEGIDSNIYGTTVSVDVILARGDQRPLTLEEFESLWREKAGPIPSAESLSFQMEGGFGFWRPDITIDLSHPQSDSLHRASQALKEGLAEYQVTSDINDSYQRGSPRLDFKINDKGRTLGLTPQLVGEQVRNAFQGAEAKRFLRGPNEVRIRVKLPDNQQDSEYHVRNLMLQTPQGGEAPLFEVATVTQDSTFQEINRRQGRRIVTIESDVNPKSQISRMLTTMKEELLPQLASDYPGLTWSFQGRQVQMRESLSALFGGLLLAVLGIYALLAIPFQSYVQPVIVMVALPFGAFGATIGHLLLGYNMSVLSLMGIVGLSGVVVNDSLIMVDYANRLRHQHSPIVSITEAAIRRFRPILLTTLTTFGGLAPIILETSRQARFLIPMAISLGFGILFATAILILMVPCFYMVVEDVKALAKKLTG